MQRPIGIAQRVFALILAAFLATPISAQTESTSDIGDRGALEPAPAVNIDHSSGGSDALLEPKAGAIPTYNLLQVMRDGGPLMWPIAVCSFVFVIFVLERLISLRAHRVIPRPFVKRFLQQLDDGELDAEGAVDLCEENGSPMSEILAAAVKKWGRPSVEIEQAIIDTGERITGKLRRYLRLFNSISNVSTMLGLLGTVTGMIQAFNDIASNDAMGRPELLANGISEALLTTAAGLVVAIPATIAYVYFVSRVDRLVSQMDAIANRVVNVIAADGWKGKRRPKGKGPQRDRGGKAA